MNKYHYFALLGFVPMWTAETSLVQFMGMFMWLHYSLKAEGIQWRQLFGLKKRV